MKFCPYCGAGLQEDMSFCPVCGKEYHGAVIQEATEAEYCLKCGEKLLLESAFCSYCGADVPTQQEFDELKRKASKQMPEPERHKRKKPPASSIQPETPTAQTARLLEKEKRKWIGMVAIAVCVIIAVVTLSLYLVFEHKYEKALSAIGAADNKDAEDLEGMPAFDRNKEMLKGVQVGDTIYWGKYEQDNVANGTEALEWGVLSVQGEKALVISKYILEYKPYHNEYADVMWEGSALRAWLNNSFLNAAFSAEEQEYILQSTISNPDNPNYKTAGGRDTMDKVFLLSFQEREEYFGDGDSCAADATVYANAQDLVDAGKWDIWWLRSPGRTLKNAVQSSNEIGAFSLAGDAVDHFCGIRPAFWISLSS